MHDCYDSRVQQEGSDVQRRTTEVKSRCSYGVDFTTSRSGRTLSEVVQELSYRILIELVETMLQSFIALTSMTATEGRAVSTESTGEAKCCTKCLMICTSNRVGIEIDSKAMRGSYERIRARASALGLTLVGIRETRTLLRLMNTRLLYGILIPIKMSLRRR